VTAQRVRRRIKISGLNSTQLPSLPFPIFSVKRNLEIEANVADCECTVCYRVVAY